MAFFSNSHNFAIAYGQFININAHNFDKGRGLNLLRKALTPEAIHDSSARNPLQCLPGTREEYIRKITGWGLGGWKASQARALWLQGPAGVGKSALAQTCVERMGGRLGASFFFSRTNGWNDPTKFVPTIAYQLAMKYVAYRDFLDAKIMHDPLVLEKAIDVQFRELLVYPFGQSNSQDHGIDGSIIVVDGLDECDDQDAQRVIIEVVITSVLQRTTPFLWAFFSRPEPHIVAAFSSERINDICWQLTLPVSRDADQDIEAYVRAGFQMIRAKYNLPRAIVWPPEKMIRQLVLRSGGLFVYVESLIVHIGHCPDALGNEEQLESVLEGGKASNKSSLANPLSTLDRFYIVIMQQIPRDVLPRTLLLLFVLFHSMWNTNHLPIYCPILNFSPTAVYVALNNLHSVLEVEVCPTGQPVHLRFYHTSFADFLRDATRSTQRFCVETQDIYNQFYSACVDTLFRLSTADTNEGGHDANMLAQWRRPLKIEGVTYLTAVQHLFKLVGNVDLEANVLQRLSCINWGLVVKFCDRWLYQADDIERFAEKIPETWRPKIIYLADRSSRQNQNIFRESEGKCYVLGHGSNTALLAQARAWYCMRPYGRDELSLS